ncbi:MAG: hypothetical protein HC767_04205 [Akkermansiaceae bacterium]|nr:hypothetical protein [Akkermansiaceae bacterium]
MQASELLKAQGGLIAEQAVVITGRMSSEAKAVALDAFRAGHCRLLVSTVVIEVGIDVPAATLMVVEHAERFGLLQLHQLRGRVGRSDKRSSCLLVTSSKGALERLQVLEVRHTTLVASAIPQTVSRGNAHCPIDVNIKPALRVESLVWQGGGREGPHAAWRWPAVRAAPERPC